MNERGPVQSTFAEFDRRVKFFQTNGKMPEDIVVNYVPPSDQMVKVNVPAASGRRSSHVLVNRRDVSVAFGV